MFTKIPHNTEFPWLLSQISIERSIKFWNFQKDIILFFKFYYHAELNVSKESKCLDTYVLILEKILLLGNGIDIFDNYIKYVF